MIPLGARIKQWYMCQQFVHEINRAKWDVEVAFAKELNVLKNVSHGVDQSRPFTKLKSS